ncbi:hypothetical protein AAFP30_22385 [Gordonia sp. CPCC 205515]|uniref:hypothetical protein n=1 Tax=Gordonia sp. CPCC 205515 TaxID=3140791 RepID=UPI003AF3F11A
MPTALATTDTAQVIQGLKDDGVVYDATDAANTRDHFGTHPSDTIVVITPGTDDGTLITRSAPMMGKRTTLVVNYAQSFWPIIAGKSGTSPLLSPTYDASKEAAETANLEIMRALHGADGAHPFVIYTGYSQGADALGNAAETAWDEGLLDSDSMIVLASDPRSPWGIKSWLATMPLLPQIATAIGVESDGARDPAKTGDAEVLSVIIVGDPVSNFQWVWYRPVSSLLVDLAGFLTIHNGMSNQTYGDIDDLGDPTLLKSGNTTYAIYDGRHPLALLVALVYDELGIAYTDADLDRWDQAAEAFYPLQRPTVENAAVPVQATPTPTPAPVSASAPVSAQAYSVTVSSEVATGERVAGPGPDLTSSQTVVADDADDFGAGASNGPAVGGDGQGLAGPAVVTTTAGTDGSTVGGGSGSGDGGDAGAESSSSAGSGDESGSTGGDASDGGGASDAGSAADSGPAEGSSADTSGPAGGGDASSSGTAGDSGASTGTSSSAP